MVSEELQQAALEYTEKGSMCQEEMDAFIAGAEWMARQGFNVSGECSDGEFIDTECGILSFDNRPFEDGEKVIVQIRKK